MAKKKSKLKKLLKTVAPLAIAGLGAAALTSAPMLNHNFLYNSAFAASGKPLIFAAAEALTGNWDPTTHTNLSQLIFDSSDTEVSGIFDFENNNTIRVMKGLQHDYFSEQSQGDFFSKEYKVTKLTDRMGMRLEGEKLENIKSKNIKSEGITKGSIQIPGDGQPIILLSDHPTIGGYPKIANVITADYDKLVQKTPGSKLKFKLVDLSVAESAFKDYIKKLNFYF